jgi:hypothetical protein
LAIRLPGDSTAGYSHSTLAFEGSEMKKPMTVCDFAGSHDVTSVKQLQTILAKRYENNANSVWMSHLGAGQYPTLALVVKDNLAHLSFFPKEYDAGFTSQGNMGDDLEGTTTTFFITRGGDQIWVSNDAVLPFSSALQGVKEFFRTKELPRCVEWFKL